MSNGYSITLSDNHHAAVMDALRRLEAAWVAYEWHFDHNSDPNRKEQIAIARVRQVQEELAALGVVHDNTGELDYPLSKAELAELRDIRHIEQERWLAQALMPVISEEYQEHLAVSPDKKEAITRRLLETVYEEASNKRLRLPPEKAHAFAVKLVKRAIESVASTKRRSKPKQAA